MKAKVKDEASILMWTHLGEIQQITKFVRRREHQFFEGRRWRFDFALLGGYEKYRSNYAIEIEGGAFIQGRHTRGVGFIKDMEKYNHAALLGWRVLRFTPKQVLDGSAIAFIRKVLES